MAASGESLGAPQLRVADWDAYAVRWSAMHGGFEPRSASAPVRGWLWLAFRAAYLLGGLGVRPATVTGVGLLCCIGVPLSCLPGRFWPLAGAVLVVLAAFADTVDGAVAVCTGRVTRLGYLYDSIADRLAELSWIAALWLLRVPVWLAAAALAVSWLHEYIRARAMSAGMSGLGEVTVGEAPMRVAVAASALGLAGLAGLLNADLATGTATMATAIWTLLGLTGLMQLGSAVHTALR